MMFARYRGDLTAHIQNTVSQYNLPPLGARAGRKKERSDIPAHFPDPVVRQMVELDITVIDHLDGKRAINPTVVRCGLVR